MQFIYILQSEKNENIVKIGYSKSSGVPGTGVPGTEEFRGVPRGVPGSSERSSGDREFQGVPGTVYLGVPGTVYREFRGQYI